MTLDGIQKHQRARIATIDTAMLPLKLLEMGCLPGNEVHLEQRALLNDPMYLVIDGTHLAIRKETARYITIDIIE